METLGSDGGSHTNNYNASDEFAQSLQQVHALATASLLASTQMDIVHQLAKAISPTLSQSGCEIDKLHKPSKNNKKKIKSSGLGTEKKLEDLKQQNKTLNECRNEKKCYETEPKPLVCSYQGCNRKFAWLNHLKYHEMTHTNNRQYECPNETCGKTFFTAQRLKVHLRTHTGERPFKCSQSDCGKSFTTAGNLKNHERIHSGDQPFSCDYEGCSSRFAELSSLQKHKLTHSGDKPFECHVCNKKFTQSSSRKQHLIRHHLDKEIKNSVKRRESSKDYLDSHIEEEEEGDSTKGVEIKMNQDDVEKTATYCLPQSLSPQVVVLSLHDENIQEKADESTVLSQSSEKADESMILSQSSLLQHEDLGKIIYTTNTIEHEEKITSNYMSFVAGDSEDIVVSEYYAKELNIQMDVPFHHSEKHISNKQPKNQFVIQNDNLSQMNFPDAHNIGKEELPSPFFGGWWNAM